jgi:acetylornithine/N-succinyldiaminopimelate aminotransferase
MSVQADHIMATYIRRPIEFASGRGCTLTDTDGNEYLDMVAGIAVMSVGHSHPKVIAAIAEQTARLVHVSNLFETQPQKVLAARLAELTAGHMSFFCNSGAEAIEAALKLARRYGGPERTRIVAAEGGFHGRTFGALAATGQPKKREAFEPLPAGFTHVPFDDVDTLEAELGPDVAAVLLEPIQGEAGVIVPDDGYLSAVRKACDEAGALLILDEIQTGLGRTGRWFASDHYGVVADVICLAKALAGGLPMGACLARPDVAVSFRPGDHASTFGGGPVQSAAALTVLDVIESEGLLERASVNGDRLAEGLSSIFGDAATIRGKGLLIGVAFENEIARRLADLALETGLLINDATPTVVRLCPPLVITEDEIDRGLSTLESVWNEMRKSQ